MAELWPKNVYEIIGILRAILAHNLAKYNIFHETKFVRQVPKSYTFLAIFNSKYSKTWFFMVKTPKNLKNGHISKLGFLKMSLQFENNSTGF